MLGDTGQTVAEIGFTAVDFSAPDAARSTSTATLSRIDIVGNGLGRWKTMPTVRRTATGSIVEA